MINIITFICPMILVPVDYGVTYQETYHEIHYREIYYVSAPTTRKGHPTKIKVNNRSTNNQSSQKAPNPKTNIAIRTTQHNEEKKELPVSTKELC